MAHDTAHGDGAHAHGAHAHGTHHDTSGDKGAAFVGMIAGMLLLGSFLFGMVKWTNYHLGAGEAGSTAAESTK